MKDCLILAVVALLVLLAGCFGDAHDDENSEATDETLPIHGPGGCDLPLLDERVRMRELDVAVDPNDRSRIAVGFIGAPPAVQDDSPSDWPYWVGVALSQDNGTTWDWTWAGTPPDTMEYLGLAPDGAPAEVLSDPIVLFAQDGTLLFSMLAIDGTARHVVARYEPGDLVMDSAAVVARGGAHPALSQVPTPLFVLWNEKQHLHLDPATGDVMMGWEWRFQELVYLDDHYTRAAAMFSISRDGGRTWADPVQVSPEGGVVGADDYHAADPHPFRDRNGTYHLYWLDYNGGGIYHASSGDGSDWQPPDQIATVEKQYFGYPEGVLASYFFEVAMDTSGGEFDGRTYIVTTDFSAGSSRLVLLWSDDHAVWNGPYSFTRGDENPQHQPALAVAPDGTIGVLFGDGRNTTSDDWSFAPYLAESRDGAGNFTEKPVTLARSDPRHIDNRRAEPPQPDHPIMPNRSRVGDYWGLDATADGWFLAWQDGRDGSADVPYSTGYVCHVVRAA